VARTAPGEAFANLRQPNQFATLTWIGAAVLLWGTLGLRSGISAALIVLLAVGSAASVSRTGVLEGLALTRAGGLWNGPQRRQRMLQCALAGVAYFAAAWLLPALLEAFAGALPGRTLLGRVGAAEGCGSRIVLWSNVLHLIAQKPLAGWGWGNLDYAHFATLYDGPALSATSSTTPTACRCTWRWNWACRRPWPSAAARPGGSGASGPGRRQRRCAGSPGRWWR
jgi:O-antigen ligase